MSGWISVSERLPEIDYSKPEYSRWVTVLAHRKGQVFEMTYLSQGFNKTEKGRAPRWERHFRIDSAPDHWMPMPPPP